jgi:hypothetical protein
MILYHFNLFSFSHTFKGKLRAMQTCQQTIKYWGSVATKQNIHLIDIFFLFTSSDHRHASSCSPNETSFTCNESETYTGNHSTGMTLVRDYNM